MKCDNCGSETFVNPQSAGTTPDEKIRYGGFGLLLAGALAALGSILPWLTATGGFTTVSVSGMDDGGDGIFSLAAGIAMLLAGMMIVSSAGKPQGWGTLGLLATIGLGAVTFSSYTEVQERVDRFSVEVGQFGRAAMGAGIWTLVFAAAIGGIASIIVLSATQAVVQQPPKE